MLFPDSPRSMSFLASGPQLSGHLFGEALPDLRGTPVPGSSHTISEHPS